MNVQHSMLCFVVDYITLAVNGHGRGTRLGTCLVQRQCFSCVITLQHVSMFQFLDWTGHARGMRLGTRPMYTTCGVAFVASVTGAGWRFPKTLYAHKQRSGVVQNNILLLQIASNKHARL